jgi:hypothetical protein
VILICVALVLALVAQAYFNGREREKLLRRIQAPQNVIVEEATAHKRPTPERVWTDEQYRQLMLSRSQIPRDN